MVSKAREDKRFCNLLWGREILYFMNYLQQEIISQKSVEKKVCVCQYNLKTILLKYKILQIKLCKNSEHLLAFICLFWLQERYVASLMPLQKSISPWKVCGSQAVSFLRCLAIMTFFDQSSSLSLNIVYLVFQSPPQLRQFLPEEFMKTLEKTGPQLTSGIKGDWIGLYRSVSLVISTVCESLLKKKKKKTSCKTQTFHVACISELWGRNERLAWWHIIIQTLGRRSHKDPELNVFLSFIASLRQAWIT